MREEDETEACGDAGDLRGGLKVEGVSEERISISASIRVFIFLTIKHKPVQYTHAQQVRTERTLSSIIQSEEHYAHLLLTNALTHDAVFLLGGGGCG